MPQVWNAHVGRPPRNAVYIGRPSVWGNPYAIGMDGSRAVVVQRFREWVLLPAQSALRELARQELRGHDLLCFCAPKECHGSVWVWVANSKSDAELVL